MTTLNEMIGSKLKEARINADMSLREVADMVGKNYSTIHSYESGKRAINVDFMETLCDVYGVNYLDLLTEIYYEKKLLNK